MYMRLAAIAGAAITCASRSPDEIGAQFAPARITVTLPSLLTK
jgi:hypothetical protein